MITIKVDNRGGTWKPTFTIGNQSFSLAECEDKESAIWMAEQLRVAFKKAGVEL